MSEDRERAEDEMYNRLTEAYVRDGDTDVPDPREVFCDILTAVRAERDEEWDKAWVDRRRLLENQFNLEREEWAKAARAVTELTFQAGTATPKITFRSEAYLYDKLGKEDARTLLHLLNALAALVEGVKG